MMEDKHLRNVYPVSWVTESPRFIKYIEKWHSDSKDNLLVADFASGEHDRIPTFFTKELPRLLKHPPASKKRIIVYCTDIHALRLDSLLGKLEEDDLLNNVRVVHAALETMDTNAKLRTPSMDFIKDNPDIATWLDNFLIREQAFPSECFDVGILNADVVGYMHEYYKEYSDALIGLQKVQRLIRNNGLLVVTMPCSLYVIDNVAVLEEVGFKYLQGVDIKLSSGEKTYLEKNVKPASLSRLGHYTFLIFTKI